MRMKALLLCVLLGCAQDGNDGADGEDGESVDLVEFGRSSTCPAGGVRLTVGKTSKEVCHGEAGPMGAMGSPGTAGRDGQAGAQGGAWVPQTVVACVALTSLPVSRTPANLKYTLLRFSDGAAIVTCSAETTGLVSADSTWVYAPWQRGAGAATCLVTSDASGAPTSGWWRFEMVGGIPRATYNDPETGDDQAMYLFTDADCPTSARPN